MKGLLILSNLVEDIEAIGTRDLLIRAGCKIDTVTFEESLIIKTSYGLEICVDDFAQNVRVDEYDFLIIPGGPYVGKIVDQDQDIKNLAIQFHQKEKLIAAICAGPRFLGQAGLLDGKKYTAFHGSDKDAPKGHYQPNDKAVLDGQIITARGAGAIYEFAYEITKYLMTKEKALKVQESIMY